MNVDLESIILDDISYNVKDLEVKPIYKVDSAHLPSTTSNSSLDEGEEDYSSSAASTAAAFEGTPIQSVITN
jgi:hypothetical protein